MGAIFKVSSMDHNKFNKLMTPIVFCTSEDKMASYIKNYNILNINKMLPQKLFQHEHDKWNVFITDELNNIINDTNEPILIKDFEILFDPQFEIDVLKFFVMANRKKKTSVLWCGKYKTGKLIFAEPEYEDYKSYNIKDYDISCIV